MRMYRTAFLIGASIPVILHLLGQRGESPWWPDTVTFSLLLGAVAVFIVSKTRSDREAQRRLWKTIRDLTRHRIH